MDVFALLPRDLNQISYIWQSLFNLSLPFRLSTTDFKLYWPIIDNVYIIRRTSHMTADSGDFKRYTVICRLKWENEVALSSSLKSYITTMKRTKRYYNMAFCLLEYVNHIEFHWLGNNPLIHEHSLDESDAIKRNSATVNSGYTGFGYTGLHIFLSLYRRTQQNRAGIICMRAGINIPEFSLYRIYFCPAHTNFLCPV